MNIKRLAELQALHKMYCAYNQAEPANFALMVKLGHPCCEDYKSLRAFFDALKYASNSNSRLFSYVDSGELSEYSAPKLGLSWRPEGIAGFSSIYPADEAWPAYIEKCAELGWPKGCTPHLFPGQWTIHTRQLELMDALDEYQETTTGARASRPWIVDGESSFHIVLSICAPGPTMSLYRESQEQLLVILRRYHRKYILPARTEADDIEDGAAVPMKDKHLMLGNVEQVTITAKSVLVPLIPLGATQAQITPIAEDVIEAVRQGLPFEQAEDWLSRVLDKKAFAEVKSQFKP